jgi:signal transduction histidine kinase
MWLQYKYSILPFVGSFLFLAMGLVAIFSPAKKKLTVPFLFLSITTFIWQFSWAVLFRQTDSQIGMDIIRFGYFFIIFLPTAMYHFLIEISETYSDRKWLKLAYGLDVVFAVSVIFTNLFVSGYFHYSWGFYPKAGIFHPLHILQTSLMVSRGLWIVYVKSKAVSGKIRHQLMYCVVALLVYFFAAIDYLVNYGVGFYPPGIIFVFISLFILTYAVTKHEFLNIKVLITRSVASALMLLIAGLTILGTYFLPSGLTQIALIGLVLIWAVLGEIIALRIQTPLKKILLRGYYEPTKVISKISEDLIYIQDRFTVMKSIGEAFSENLELEYAYSIVRDSESETSTFLITEIDTDRVLGELEGTDPFFDLVRNQKDSVFLESVDAPSMASLHMLPLKKGSVLMPIQSIECLHGALILGPKLTEKRFDDSDFQFLSMISSQIITVFDRIRFQEKLLIANDQLETMNVVLTERVKEEVTKKERAIMAAEELARNASMATLASGISHEIRNPMGGIKAIAGRLLDRHQNAFFDSYPWKPLVTLKSLTAITQNSAQSQQIWDRLVELELMDHAGAPTENAEPFYQPVTVTLPDDLKSFEPAVHHLITETSKYNTLYERLETIVRESLRVVNIASTMLRYGAATGITKAAFEGLPGIDQSVSDELYYQLIERGYLDRFGGTTDQFDLQNPDFGLDLDLRFHRYIPVLRDGFAHIPQRKRTEVDITSVVKQVLQLTRDDLLAQNIQVDAQLQVSGIAWGDHDRLFQMFMNLIKNAIESMGTTDRESRRLEIATVLESFQNKFGETVTGLCIILKDTGCGIAPVHLDRIREPFFTTKGPTGGKNAGMGMSIVYTVVDFFGGLIMVESQVGVGTTFKVFLPVNR